MTPLELEDVEIKRILAATRRIALVGASNRPNRPSYGVMQFLIERGYDVTPVNPGLAGVLIHNKLVVGSLAEAAPLDMVDLFRDPADLEDDVDTRASLDTALLAGAEAALDALVSSREQEGAAIRDVLLGHIERIEALTEAAEANPARRPEVIRERLQRQIEDLIGAAPSLDSSRLYQEAVLIATKADIREEIDRLRAHVGQARQLLAGGGAVGRRLDFLAQEFNRESNTLCSKSNDTDLTAIGLDLKAAIDQLREQIQNIE